MKVECPYCKYKFKAMKLSCVIRVGCVNCSNKISV